MATILNTGQGGTGQDTSAKTGLVSLYGGTWDFSDVDWVGSNLTSDATTLAGTDDSTELQSAITALAASGKPSILRVHGGVRLNSSITLASNICYDFRAATFYPGTGITDAQMFYGASLSNFEILGGRFLKATYSPETIETSGTYIDGTGIHLVGCSDFRIHRGYFSEWFTDINTYDCSHFWVDHNYHYNSNASIVLLSHDAAIQDIHCLYNKIVGAGDDGIFVGGQTAGGSTVKDVWINENYIDKSRFGSSASIAVGIRIGNYSGAVGELSNINVCSNVMRDMVENGLIAFDVTSGIFRDNVVDGYAKRPAAAYLFGLDTGNAITADIIGNHAKNPLSATGYGANVQYLSKSKVIGNTLKGNYPVVPTLLIQQSDYNLVMGNYLSNADVTDGRCLEESTTSGNSNNIFELNDVRDGSGAAKFYMGGTSSVQRLNPDYS